MIVKTIIFEKISALLIEDQDLRGPVGGISECYS